VTPLSFDAFFLENPRKYPHEHYIAETRVPKICAADSLSLSLLVFTQLLSKISRLDIIQTSVKTEYNEIAIQGHAFWGPRKADVRLCMDGYIIMLALSLNFPKK